MWREKRKVETRAEREEGRGNRGLGDTVKEASEDKRWKIPLEESHVCAQYVCKRTFNQFFLLHPELNAVTAPVNI